MQLFSTWSSSHVVFAGQHATIVRYPQQNSFAPQYVAPLPMFMQHVAPSGASEYTAGGQSVKLGQHW